MRAGPAVLFGFQVYDSSFGARAGTGGVNASQVSLDEGSCY